MTFPSSKNHFILFLL